MPSLAYWAVREHTAPPSLLTVGVAHRRSAQFRSTPADSHSAMPCNGHRSPAVQRSRVLGMPWHAQDLALPDDFVQRRSANVPLRAAPAMWHPLSGSDPRAHARSAAAPCYEDGFCCGRQAGPGIGGQPAEKRPMLRERATGSGLICQGQCETDVHEVVGEGDPRARPGVRAASGGLVRPGLPGSAAAGQAAPLCSCRTARRERGTRMPPPERVTDKVCSRRGRSPRRCLLSLTGHTFGAAFLAGARR
jgi:hypothetical protein